MDVYSYFLKSHESFTKIQKLAFPVIEGKSNALIVAPTGSGKTEAAFLPMLNDIVKNHTGAGMALLYITPLRALNRDMLLRLESICAEFGVSMGVRHGDTSTSEKSKQTRKPPTIMITTPETLQSILPTKYLGPTLKNLKYVIVDEIHELYYNKRGAQLSLALERLEELSPGFIRVGLSATVGNTETISKFLCGSRQCKVINSEESKKTEIKVLFPDQIKHPNKDIMEKFGLDAASAARLEVISEEIKSGTSTLIFANTRQIVEALGNRLIYMQKIKPFGGIGVHHSSIEKSERIKMESDFKNGEIKGLLATSSLELGIDIGTINKVIQYGSPRQALRLIQRVGRSGHTSHGKPVGKILATGIMDAIESTAVAMNAADSIIENYSCQFGSLDVLANQVCGIALDKGAIRFENLLGMINRSYVYGGITKDELSYLLDFMSKQRLLGFDGNTISAGKSTRMYYYEHLSVIPDTKRYMVKNIATSKIVSSLDERFVASKLEEGMIFITKGLPWKVISIGDDIIYAEPSTDIEGAVPDWSGEDIPVSREVAVRVSSIISTPSSINEYNVNDEPSEKRIREFSNECSEYSLNSRSFIIEKHPEYIAIYTFLGTLGNEALSRIMGHLLSIRFGRSINIRSSPYMIFIELNQKVDIEELLRSINPDSIAETIDEFLEKSEIFSYHFVYVAKMFGIIDREAKVSKSLTRRLVSIFRDSPVYKEARRELMQNYFDIEGLSSFTKSLRKNELRPRLFEVDTITKMTKAIMDSAYYTKELIMPLTPSNELLNSFVEYTTSKSIKLLCTYCGFYFAEKISDLKEKQKIVCPNCSSPMIAVYKDDLKSIVDKRKKGIKLERSEKKKLDEAMAEADLFSSYGWKAAAALATYGIGPRAAARALMMLRREDKLFYIDLIEAQKQFIKNKKYWSI
jgi:ATP-dependent Lhr-like helicase